MVTFSDMKDPKTVQLVFETEPSDVHGQGGLQREFRAKTDNLEKLFGSGVKLKDITIEITDKPVTRMISRYLPSYDHQQEYMKWFNSLPYADPRKINIYDFK